MTVRPARSTVSESPSGTLRTRPCQAMAGAAAQVFSILPSQAEEAAGRTIKVALIGCGGRGNGALDNHKSACDHLGLKMQLVATADAFVEKAKETGKKYGLAEDKCFGGFEAYKKVMASDAEIVLMRAFDPTLDPEIDDLDVPDPYYGSTSDFEDVLAMIEAATPGTLARIRELLA